MRRLALLGVAALLAAGVSTFSAAPAGAVSFNCDWTTVIRDRPAYRWTGYVKAGPLLEVGATSVDVVCEIRIDDPDGPVIGDSVQNTPGPVGFFDRDLTIGGSGALNRDFYICTYTVPHPGGATHAHGCSYAFTAN